MNWRLFVASRYLKTRREKFISIISLISILGVAVGVAALIVVIAVMSGFDNELKTRIIGTTAHIFIERDDGVLYPDPLIDKVLSANQDVVSESPFIAGQVILKNDLIFSGAILTGIDEDTEKYVTDVKQYLVEGGSPRLGDNGILVGSELADKLGLEVGDEVSVVSASTNRPFDFMVTGTLRTGLYTFDASNIFISLKPAQELFGIERLVTGVSVNIKDALKADKVKRDIAVELGFPYFVRSWVDLNANLFSALKLEKIAMFIILTLIVIVACFNIASTLIVRVVQKTKDIGILKAIGATNRDIRGLFRLEGLFIGLIGTAIGTGVGIFLGWLQKTYKIIRLSPDVYYIDALPVYISWHDPLVIAFSAIILSLIATLYPSHKASRLNVVDALRYE
ncbi:MAG: ABC transporter permease [Candidatus Omnitrophica bacterium]|nr:ABC transporter permease [Candidatus Omnitrophota bacterium]